MWWGVGVVGEAQQRRAPVVYWGAGRTHGGRAGADVDAGSPLEALRQVLDHLDSRVRRVTTAFDITHHHRCRAATPCASRWLEAQADQDAEARGN